MKLLLKLLLAASLVTSQAFGWECVDENAPSPVAAYTGSASQTCPFEGWDLATAYNYSQYYYMDLAQTVKQEHYDKLDDGYWDYYWKKVWYQQDGCWYYYWQKQWYWVATTGWSESYARSWLIDCMCFRWRNA